MKNSTSLPVLMDYVRRTGLFFGAVYEKKDGTITKVNARFGVTKHLNGGKRTVPSSMYVVWDTNRKRYTAMEPERIKSVTIKGFVYGIADAE